MKSAILLLTAATVTASAQTRAMLPDSGLSYSPDSAMVAFVRPTPARLIPTALGSVEATELWVAHRDGSFARRVVVGKSTDDPRNVLADLSSPAFSPDGRRVYFLSTAWVTSGAVHMVNLSTRQSQYIAAGNSLDVIVSGEYAGCLLVGQHRYWMAGGSYDWLWLLTPTGKDVGPVVDDDTDAVQRLVEWRHLFVPRLNHARPPGAGSVRPLAACLTPTMH